MAAADHITMTMRELDRFKVIQDVVDGKIKPWHAAQRLDLTTRQIRRLADRLRKDGPAGLISGRRHKPSNNQLAPSLVERAVAIIRERYADFGRHWRLRSSKSVTASTWPRKRCASS